MLLKLHNPDAIEALLQHGYIQLDKSLDGVFIYDDELLDRLLKFHNLRLTT